MRTIKQDNKNLDKLETQEDYNIKELPNNHKKESIYVHRNPNPNSDDLDLGDGDLVGYCTEGDLWVVETDGWEYTDLNGNLTEGEVFLHYAEKALNLEVAGYLDNKNYFNGDSFVSGEDLTEVAEKNLDNVERGLKDYEIVSN